MFLTVNEQWDLFAFFLPHQDLSEQQLIQHRQDISEADPSLPQRAGRALKRLEEADIEAAYWRERMRLPHKKNGKRTVHIFSEINPDFKPEDLAKILVSAASDAAWKAKKEREKKA